MTFMIMLFSVFLVLWVIHGITVERALQKMQCDLERIKPKMEDE